MSEKKRQWTEIQVRFDNGDVITLYRDAIDKMVKFAPMLEALDIASDLRNQLNLLLKRR